MKIIHLDDQCERANWIPRKLTTYLWRNYRPRLLTYPVLTEDDAEAQFELSIDLKDGPLKLEYWILDTVDSFWEEVGSSNNLRGILLDQWVHEDHSAGSTCFKRIQAEYPHLVNDTVLFTAYPQEACQELGWQLPNDKLIQKPPAMDVVMRWVTDRILLP